MNDIFKEQLVAREKGAKERAMMAGILVAALAAIGISSLLPVISDFMFFAAAAILVGAFMLLQRFNVEYEYILTNKDLDIDRILNKAKRKRVVSLNVSEFELVAPLSDQASAQAFASCSETIDCSSGKHKANTYGGIYIRDGKRVKLVFEPEETILSGIRQFIPKKVK